MLALDFESTGKNPLTARVVQVAAVDLVPAERGQANAPAFDVDRWATIVNPGDDVEFPQEAVDVHGITREHATAEGRPIDDVIPEVLDRVHACWAAGGVVIGHNLGGYDCTLLWAETGRLPGVDDFEVRGCVIDTLVLDRCDLLHARDRFRKNTTIAPDGEPVRSRKLVDAVRWWGVPMDAELAHDATEDALASARIAWRMCQRYPQLAWIPLDELHAYQGQQRAAWAKGFTEHVRKLKKKDGAPQAEIDAFEINGEWPIQTWHEEDAA